jgi:hypothetical protein
MLRLFAAVAVIAAGVPALADEPSKPKTLSQKEIADGWVMLFDGETTFGWKIDGPAEVKDGVLVLGKGKKATASATIALGTDYEIAVEWQGKGTIRSSYAEIEFEQEIGADKRWKTSTYTWDAKTRNHEFGGDGSLAHNKWQRGDPAVKITTDGQTPALLRSVKIRPTGAAPLFTGKNLDGWKVNAADPKRMSSKWTVTADGELSVKNGPGDLVCEKEFDNFVLQLECKTLGPALNSGVFFRCIPKQYQNGYEAQIQNAYKGDDRTKPVDFGTGAIYRRVPARKVVSNDNEWFTMTVIAEGRHIATWVNGYQTVDWTDDRKDNENPRNGYRAAKGPISLQGHDPTTDILFRNIRIVELAK